MNKLKLTHFIKISVAFLLLIFASACTSTSHIIVPLPNYEEVSASHYAKSEELDKTKVALLPIEIRVFGEVATVLYPYMNPRVKADLSQLKCKLAKNVTSILRAKDLQATRKFSSMKTMTYADKKSTTMVLKISIDVEFDHRSRDYSSLAANGKFNTKSTIVLRTYEPISGEKTWQKTLPLVRSNYNLKYNLGCGIFDICEEPSYEPTHIHKGIVSGVLEVDRLIYEVYKATAKGIEKNFTKALIAKRLKEALELKGVKGGNSGASYSAPAANPTPVIININK